MLSREDKIRETIPTATHGNITCVFKYLIVL